MARSRTRRALKWTGTLACVLILGVWICSAWYSIRLGVIGDLVQLWAGGERIPNNYEGLLVYAGTVSVTWIPPSERVEFASYLRLKDDLPEELPWLWVLRFPDPPVFGWCLPSFDNAGTCQRTIAVPCWLVFFLFAPPTALLWYRERRPIPPGHCQKCGYDLTGNVSGRCPECGTLVGSEKEAR